MLLCKPYCRYSFLLQVYILAYHQSVTRTHHFLVRQSVAYSCPGSNFLFTDDSSSVTLDGHGLHLPPQYYYYSYPNITRPETCFYIVHFAFYLRIAFVVPRTVTQLKSVVGN